MRSAVAPADAAETDAVASALAAAVARYDGPTAVAAMIRYHFGFDAGAPARAHDHPLARLVLRAAEEEGGTAEAALPAACAVEMLLHSSLVHDDVSAERIQRCGRPSVWAAYGMAHGINTGDAMCALSHLTLLGAETHAAADVVAMTRRLHEATLLMCAERGRAFARGEAAPASRAALLAAACALGASSAGARAERADAYARLARTESMAARDALARAAAIDARATVRGALQHGITVTV